MRLFLLILLFVLQPLNAIFAQFLTPRQIVDQSLTGLRNAMVDAKDLKIVEIRGCSEAVDGPNYQMLLAASKSADKHNIMVKIAELEMREIAEIYFLSEIDRKSLKQMAESRLIEKSYVDQLFDYIEKHKPPILDPIIADQLKRDVSGLVEGTVFKETRGRDPDLDKDQDYAIRHTLYAITQNEGHALKFNAQDVRSLQGGISLYSKEEATAICKKPITTGCTPEASSGCSVPSILEYYKRGLNAGTLNVVQVAIYVRFMSDLAR